VTTSPPFSLMSSAGSLPRSTRPGSIRDADLREELDIDSMDFLNLVAALHERLDLDIPEIDYPNLATLGHAVDYLAQRLGAAA
jgi:acyl carrier protein